MQLAKAMSAATAGDSVGPAITAQALQAADTDIASLLIRPRLHTDLDETQPTVHGK